jgi:hypothetical protein
MPSGNFMTLSEDEDDDDDDEPAAFDMLPSPDEDEDEDADLLDPSFTDDQLIMLIARLDDGDLRSAPTPPRSSSYPNTNSSKGSSRASARSSSIQPSSPRRRNKATLGLKSFMDLHNDERDSSRWSWRSFIEVST